MYTLTLSAAAVLNSDHRRVVLYALVGVMWGWAVAGVAFLPYALLLLLVGAPIVYLLAGVVFLVGTVTPMVAFDRLFYGKWTVSSRYLQCPYSCDCNMATKLTSAFQTEYGLWSRINKAAFAVPGSACSQCAHDLLHCLHAHDMLHCGVHMTCCTTVATQ